MPICPTCGDALYPVYDDGAGDFADGITMSYMCEGCHEHFEQWEIVDLEDEFDEGEFE